jgi:hypothetical protein
MTNAQTDGAQRKEALRFSSTEMAVIYQVLLGPRLPGGGNVLGDLQVTQAELEQARHDLLARAALMLTPDQSGVRLEPSLWAVFNTLLYPQVLGMLQVSQSDSTLRTVCVSWTPGRTMLNSVDITGTHHLEPLASATEVADALLHECGLDDQTVAPAASANGSAAASPEAVAEKASLRALFVVTTNLGSPDLQAEAVSWLLSDGQVWLMAQHNASTAAMNRVTQDELHVLLEAFAQRISDSVLALDQAG